MCLFIYIYVLYCIYLYMSNIYSNLYSYVDPKVLDISIRKTIHTSIHISVQISIHISSHTSIHRSFHSIYWTLFISWFIPIYTYPFIHSATHLAIHLFISLDISVQWGTPKWMVYSGKCCQNGLFGGTPILGNHHMVCEQTCQGIIQISKCTRWYPPSYKLGYNPHKL